MLNIYCICILSILSSHSDNIVQSAIKSLDPDEVTRVGGAGHKVIASMIVLTDCVRSPRIIQIFLIFEYLTYS